MWGPALVAMLLLAACGSPALDEEQAAVERRTCASLRERVAARVLDEGGGVFGQDAASDPLSAASLRDDPAGFYRALAKLVTDAGLGPRDAPSPVSPASLLVDACRAPGK